MSSWEQLTTGLLMSEITMVWSTPTSRPMRSVPGLSAPTTTLDMRAITFTGNRTIPRMLSYSNPKAFIRCLRLIPFFRLTNSLGKGYVPVVWPGTSNYHLSNNLAHLDYFPRDNGSFYELQVNTVMKQKPLFIYTAMFDEVNEGKK